MASLFTTTARITHITPLPPTTTLPQAIAMLHDYDFILHCDPHLAKYEMIPTSTPPALPAAIQSRRAVAVEGDNSSTATVSYSVTDVVHAIPAGLWDTNVVSTYEFTRLANGIFVRIKSPMAIVMDTVWEVKEGKEGLEMVEDVEIRCSRLLMGVVKGQCEGNWRAIHGKMVGRLEAEAATKVEKVSGES
ncbi:hypothetical protein B0T17DRAFT_250452, partial [Bombardia bombarda]